MEYLGLFTQLLKSLLAWFLNFCGIQIEANRQHDIKNFDKLDAIADEAKIDDILNRAIYTSHFFIEEDRVLTDLIEGLVRVQNRYLDPQLRKNAEKLAQDMDGLLKIVRTTFWKVPGGWLRFRPDPIDPTVYNAEWDELTKKIDDTWDAYKKYRLSIKEKLKV